MPYPRKSGGDRDTDQEREHDICKVSQLDGMYVVCTYPSTPTSKYRLFSTGLNCCSYAGIPQGLRVLFPGIGSKVPPAR